MALQSVRHGASPQRRRIRGTRRKVMMTDSPIAARVLSPSDYRRMPWKNGGGLTTEIVVVPPDANFDAFAWRVSMADVDESGPFSTLADIERVLVLTAGNGMRLTGDGTTLDVTQPYE